VINSRDEIMTLLNEYIITQQEYTYQSWIPETEVTEWDGKRQAIYANGVVLGKFREKDASTLQVLKEGVSNQGLYNEIRINLEHHIKIIEEMECLDYIYKVQLESYMKQKNELSCDSIDDWISKNCRSILEETAEKSSSEIRVLLFLYYSFENYNRQRQHPFCSDLNELEMVYGKLLDKQSQFYKYGIVSINEERELLPVNPPRIYDRTLNRTFFTKNVPLNLLKIISEMLSSNIIKKFSVRLLNELGYNGRIYYEYIAESLERGKIFDFVDLGNYSISKLYSKKYEDCMWIAIDSQNITFEELCENFEIYNDMVVTQVVHLQYKIEGKFTYITHLDHEYVFYTIDEYVNRMSNATQKGTAKARMKSFKIDDSRIPFDYRCEVLKKDENGDDLLQKDEQFLCYILESYFIHKDLLKEYFKNILK